MTDHAASEVIDDPPPKEISGRWIVVAMFLFGLSAVGAMYGYWHYHREPFLPLQQALAEEYPDSQPRVEGGQRKIHKETPHVLRITMRIDFDPTLDEKRALALSEHVAQFVVENQDTSGYGQLEIHFFWPEPEQEIKRFTKGWELPLVER